MCGQRRFLRLDQIIEHRAGGADGRQVGVVEAEAFERWPCRSAGPATRRPPGPAKAQAGRRVTSSARRPPAAAIGSSSATQAFDRRRCGPVRRPAEPAEAGGLKPAGRQIDPSQPTGFASARPRPGSCSPADRAGRRRSPCRRDDPRDFALDQSLGRLASSTCSQMAARSPAAISLPR